MKSFKDLTMTDPFLFYEIMGEPENCKPLLEALLGQRLEEISTRNEHDLLGVRVSAESVHGTRYDISLQLPDMRELGKRARASQAIMDGDALNMPDSLFDTLRSCIIMVCPEDPFGLGWAVYEQSHALKGAEAKYDDGACVLFLNMKFKAGNARETVRDFLHWLNKECNASVSPYLTQLEKAVQAYKSDPFMERAYNGK